MLVLIWILQSEVDRLKTLVKTQDLLIRTMKLQTRMENQMKVFSLYFDERAALPYSVGVPLKSAVKVDMLEERDRIVMCCLDPADALAYAKAIIPGMTEETNDETH